MTLEEKLAKHKEHEKLLMLFLGGVDDKTLLYFRKILETVIGTLIFHASLASVASNKKRFLFHIREMDKADKIVLDALKDLGYECFKLDTLDSIILGIDDLVTLQPKVIEFGLQERRLVK